MLETAGLYLGIMSHIKKIRDYLKPKWLQMRRRIDGRTHSFEMENYEIADYWGNLLGEKFYNLFDKQRPYINNRPISIGDYVSLNNIDIVQWTPAFPGKLFSTEGLKVIEDFKKEFPENHDYGLEEELVIRNNSIVLQGAANLRLLPRNNGHLISGTYDFVDAGIPLLISEKMFSEKLQYDFGKETTLTGRIEGVICEIPGEWKDQISKMTRKNTFLQVYNLPHYVLKVEKIKSIGSGRHVWGNIWTMYHDPTYTDLTFLKNAAVDFEKEEVSIEKAVSKLMEYNSLLRSGLIGGDHKPVIQFDERKDWFAGRKIIDSKTKGSDEFAKFWHDFG